eukprot:gene3269-5712_t
MIQGQKLNKNIFPTLQMGRVFKENKKEINSISFSDDGNFLATSGDDETMQLYDVNEGRLQKKTYSKKYGCDKICFTHSESEVLCASKNDFDDSIRYYSFYDNKFLQYFSGHRGRVTSISMSPSDDTFVSSSVDNTIRLWDLKTNYSHASVKVQGKSYGQIGTFGKVLAVATSVNLLKLYDVRNVDQGAFDSCVLDSQTAVEYTGLKFGPRGNTICVTTTNSIIILDAMQLEKKILEITDFSNESALSLEACYTPDEEYIMIGSEDGKIHIWEIFTGNKITVLSGHAGPVHCLKFNPKYLMMASSCQNLAFWIPSEDHIKIYPIKPNLHSTKMKRYETPAWSSKPTIKYYLEVLKNGTIIDTIKFPENEQFVVIGRNEELCTNNFVFEHPSISRQHAIIQHRNNGRIYIYDLGSTHHTFWNKEEIKSFHYIPLRCGDLLKFGESTRQYVVSSDDQKALLLSEQQRKIQNKALEEVVKKHVAEKKNLFSKDDENENESEEDEEEKDVFDEEDEEELRNKKRLRIEDEVNPYSMFDEDDEFFDRTKKPKIKKVKERVETQHTLSKQREKIHLEILELEKRKKEINDRSTLKQSKNQANEEEDDPLDAYMREMEKKIVTEDTDNIDESLSSLLEERDRLDKLIDISKPAIATLKTKEQNKEEEKMDVITQNMFIKKKSNKPTNPNISHQSKPKKVDVQEINFVPSSTTKNTLKDTPSYEIKQPKEFKVPQKIVSAPVGLVFNEQLPSKLENNPSIIVGQEKQPEIEEDDDFSPSTLEEDQENYLHQDEMEPQVSNNESSKEEEKEELPVSKIKSAPNWYQNTDETKSEWTAPQDQKGDGRTKLNEKYGY